MLSLLLLLLLLSVVVVVKCSSNGCTDFLPFLFLFFLLVPLFLLLCYYYCKVNWRTYFQEVCFNNKESKKNIIKLFLKYKLFPFHTSVAPILPGQVHLILSSRCHTSFLSFVIALHIHSFSADKVFVFAVDYPVSLCTPQYFQVSV